MGDSQFSTDSDVAHTPNRCSDDALRHDGHAELSVAEEHNSDDEVGDYLCVGHHKVSTMKFGGVRYAPIHRDTTWLVANLIGPDQPSSRTVRSNISALPICLELRDVVDDLRSKKHKRNVWNLYKKRPGDG